MYHEGLVFKDIETGHILNNPTANFCTMDSYVDPGRQEIPSVMSGLPPFEITRILHFCDYYNPRAVGFKVGHTYEIGFSVRAGAFIW